MEAKHQEEKELILKELKKYQNDNSTMKPLYQSIKEFSSWLKDKEKQ